MSVDIRDLSDRDMFIHILIGDVGRPGWSGRNRLIARRLAELTLMAAGVLVGIAVFVTFMWSFR